MSRRRKGLPIHGWLCLDKPAGMTSTDVVTQVRRLTHAAKVGHGGTLDPIATGVLPIALGEATKTVPYVMDAGKRYAFTVRFGEGRATDDGEGEVTETSPLRPADAAIRAALPAFRGEIEQVPPTFAAVKVDGERAYDLARRGIAFGLEPRPVRIDRLELRARPDADHATFEMDCGRGAYVRAVARDLGRNLGCFAHVVALRRLAVGAFIADRALKLETLAHLVADDSLAQALMPLASALSSMPSLALTEPQAFRLRAGQTIKVAPRLASAEVEDEATVRAVVAGRVVALARLRGSELSPLRVFNL